MQSKKDLDPFVLVASSASAISARLIAHPLDTLRLRAQTWPLGSPTPTFAQLVPKPRFSNLYAGLPVALTFGVPALAVYLTSYEWAKRTLGARIYPNQRPTLSQQIPLFIGAGLLAELASGAIWTPLDVLKSRLQKGGEGTSAIRLINKIVKQEGVKGLYRGFFSSLVVFGPYISLYWTLYESLKIHFIQDYDGISHNTSISSSAAASSSSASASSFSSSALSSFSIPVTAQYTLCSVTACAISASICTPLEQVNARWQISAGQSGSVIHIAKAIWRTGGAKGFTRGLGMRVAYAIPANGISMTVYESLKRWKGI